MDYGRRVRPALSFSGENVEAFLWDYLESVTYTDVASGSSDTLDITLQDIEGKWHSAWYPKKGSTVSGSLIFYYWGKDTKVSCGTHTLDEIRTSFSPRTMKLSCLALPSDESFKTRDRVKTWEKVTLRQVGEEICARYGLTLNYSGAEVSIDKLEQNETDSSFLMNLCDSYGFGMKIHRQMIVVYEISQIEEQSPAGVLGLGDFTDVTFTDGIYGTYTGARVSYRPPDTDDDISIYLGLTPEETGRVLKVNESCSSEAEARRKAAAAVNKSNMKATTLTGTIFPRPSLCAGTCATLDSSFGALGGKYFIDKVTWTVSGKGATTQKIEAHRVQEKVVP